MSRHTSLHPVPILTRHLRVIYFSAISLPIVLGTAIAWYDTGRLDVGLFALSLLGGVLLQAGTTMTNDAFDLRYHPVRDRNISWLPQQVLQGAFAFFVVGIMVGIYIAALTGPAVVGLGVFGIVSALAYSVPPIRLAGTGVGELLAGVNLSAVTTLGSYYVQAGGLSGEALVASGPGVFLLAGVLAINGFRPDKLVEQRTLWRRIGTARAFLVYLCAVVPAYVWLLLALVRGRLPIQASIAFLSIPFVVAALTIARRERLERAGQFAAYAYLLETVLLIVAYVMG